MSPPIESTGTKGPKRIVVLDEVLPTALVAAAYRVFVDASVLPGFAFIEIRKAGDGERLGDAPEDMPRAARSFVRRYLSVLLELLPSDDVAGAAGFEVWAGVMRRSGHHTHLHVDNDEHLRQSGGELRCPLWGSILHLGPDARLEGGDTVFDMAGRWAEPSANFAFGEWTDVKERLREPLLVPRRAGRLVIFVGDLPHAVQPVADIDPFNPRVTLLANLWNRPVTRLPRSGATSHAQVSVALSPPAD